MRIPHTLNSPSISDFTTTSETEIERRTQTLIDEWLNHFFSATPFNIEKSDGSTQTKTFNKCDFLYNQDQLPPNLDKSNIHFALVDNRSTQCQSSKKGHNQITQLLTWNIFIRTPPQDPNNTTNLNPDHINRKVASDLAWLLKSPATKSLTDKGISKIKIIQEPRITPSAPFLMRQLAISMKLFIKTEQEH